MPPWEGKMLLDQTVADVVTAGSVWHATITRRPLDRQCGYTLLSILSITRCCITLARQACIPRRTTTNGWSSALFAHGQQRFALPDFCLLDATFGSQRLLPPKSRAAKQNARSNPPSGYRQETPLRLTILPYAIHVPRSRSRRRRNELCLSLSTINSKTTADRICKTSDK